MLRPTLLAVLLSAAVPTMVLAQTSQDLKNDEKTTGRCSRLWDGLFRHSATAH